MPDVRRGKLNPAFMDLAKAFFFERDHQLAETFVERGIYVGGRGEKTCGRPTWSCSRRR